MKNYLTNSGFFGGRFYIWDRLFSLGQICVGKISNYISGANFVWGWQFF